MTQARADRYTVAMTETDDRHAGPAGQDARAAPEPPATLSQSAHPPGHHAWAYGLLAVLALSLGFGGWGLWKTFSAAGASGDGHAALREQVGVLEQQVATLTRSDQISRDANRDLQVTLAERDEEISGLKADIAFYERFVGSTAQRRGLAVHELALKRQAGDAWQYVATLTQNLDRGTPSVGQLTLSIEGTRNGRLERLQWSDLRQQQDAPGREYSFKYFQQIDGEILLPAGFEPLRVSARLAPASGTAVEQTFAWADLVAQKADRAGAGG